MHFDDGLLLFLGCTVAKTEGYWPQPNLAKFKGDVLMPHYNSIKHKLGAVNIMTRLFEHGGETSYTKHVLIGF